VLQTNQLIPPTTMERSILVDSGETGNGKDLKLGSLLSPLKLVKFVVY
jgi:hypothetical protein